MKHTGGTAAPGYSGSTARSAAAVRIPRGGTAPTAQSASLLSAGAGPQSALELPVVPNDLASAGDSDRSDTVDVIMDDLVDDVASPGKLPYQQQGHAAATTAVPETYPPTAVRVATAAGAGAGATASSGMSTTGIMGSSSSSGLLGWLVEKSMLVRQPAVAAAWFPAEAGPFAAAPSGNSTMRL